MDIKALVILATAIAGGVFGAEARYTPTADFYRHVADSKTGIILELVSRAGNADGAYKETLCRTLVQELNGICVDSPEHPMCVDRSEYIKQAGCS